MLSCLLIPNITRSPTVTANDIFRRLRYIFDLKEAAVVDIFKQADHAITAGEVKAFLLKDDDPEHQKLSDLLLAVFLNGLINSRRGKKEGVQPEPETHLTNNIILRKLKIALDFKDSDMLDILSLSGVRISRHELSAFFRKAGHKHYRECKDQILRNFLNGLQDKYRPEAETAKPSVWG